MDKPLDLATTTTIMITAMAHLSAWRTETCRAIIHYLRLPEKDTASYTGIHSEGYEKELRHTRFKIDVACRTTRSLWYWGGFSDLKKLFHLKSIYFLLKAEPMKKQCINLPKWRSFASAQWPFEGKKKIREMRCRFHNVTTTAFARFFRLVQNKNNV